MIIVDTHVAGEIPLKKTAAGMEIIIGEVGLVVVNAHELEVLIDITVHEATAVIAMRQTSLVKNADLEVLNEKAHLP